MQGCSRKQPMQPACLRDSLRPVCCHMRSGVHAFILACSRLRRSVRPPAFSPCGSKTKDGVCPITSGQQTVDMLGLGELTIGENFAVLAAYILVCRIVAYLGIRFIKH